MYPFILSSINKEHNENFEIGVYCRIDFPLFNGIDEYATNENDRRVIDIVHSLNFYLTCMINTTIVEESLKYHCNIIIDLMP